MSFRIYCFIGLATNLIHRAVRRTLPIAVAAILMSSVLHAADAPLVGLRLATFDVDATPPVGSMMAYDPVKRVDELGLRCRGIVLMGAGEPIVLCAVDWIGIGNEGHDTFRETLARAAGTTVARVTVHTLHQHDAPACDFTAERLLTEAKARDFGRYEGTFARILLQRMETAVREALPLAQPITHAGHGEAPVKDVASNRRIKGPDGKIRATRYTATKDPALRAEPVGVIDPVVTVLSFWNGERPLAVLSYYACHPQSYYRTGIPSCDFPGIARFIRGQAVPEALHVHFNGAGGNIGAGKYNDGSKVNRVALANRLADGMQRAFEATQKFPVTPADIGWGVEPVGLPVAKHLDVAGLQARLANWNPKEYFGAADELAWVLRCQSGHRIDLACLRIGNVRVLHMPGELFVEYQLAAKAMRPDLKVAMAAYGDYAPGYIGTAVAYEEGGYETAPRSSNVAPGSEAILMAGMRKLLEASQRAGRPPVEGPDANRPSRGYQLSRSERMSLPDIKTFQTEPSPRFLIDWADVHTGSPYLGTRAGRPHTGAHVYFSEATMPRDPGKPEGYPPIYAVADGIVTRIDEAFRLRPVFFPNLNKTVANVRYGLGLAFASQEGEPVIFHYSIEPMIDPGDPDFYKPFLRVKPGQRVRRGDIVAYMFVPEDQNVAQNTHIHFNLNGPGGQFQSPSIFTAEIAKKFHATWDKNRLREDWSLPPTMGHRLDAKENPFGTGEKDEL